MKYLIILTIYLLSYSNSFGQTWQVINGSDFVTNSSEAFGSVPYVNKYFQINPYDNSIWFSLSTPPMGVRVLDTNGFYQEFDYQNNATFNGTFGLEFGDFAFTTDNVFTYHQNIGLYSYNGSNWSIESASINGCDIYAQKDTVWMAITSAPFLKWVNGSITPSTISGLRRIRSKNGIFWASTGTTNIILTYDSINGSLYYSPDTTNLLSWNNYDFKFSKRTDSLYSASDQGISIAYDGIFVDSITPSNSINMPSAGIIEFEFDSLDNIWAIFAPDFSIANKPTAIGYYDKSLNTWTNIYTSSNSILDFNRRMTIEVDNQNNPWICDASNIYVLKVGNLPQWLGIDENEQSKIKIYPNPTSEFVTIKIEDNIKITNLNLLDVSGKQVMPIDSSSSVIDIYSLRKGVYFLVINYDGGVLTKKIIKN